MHAASIAGGPRPKQLGRTTSAQRLFVDVVRQLALRARAFLAAIRSKETVAVHAHIEISLTNIAEGVWGLYGIYGLYGGPKGL